ncbi:interleukin-17 receptor D [Chanos chanos]|uniref:Interleukin-17 receptor D n=1 Tax=Chanos chanos TaxID=29144 RepID=A0A6J2UUW0_CHACN|nr:interleukin-17 receptor D-like [Chanos chanos]
MWRDTLTLVCLLVCVSQQEEDLFDPVSIYPQNCTSECILQGDRRCEYCQISREDMKAALGVDIVSPFGSCVPWPCQTFLGQQTPDVCQHYVHAPHNVTVQFLPNQDLTHDTVTVSWSPSQYGIAFLRGFQVFLQALGGTQTACQLFLLPKNLSLTAAHAQRVYHSDAFTGLPLDTQYAVTVMALPVPEKWDNFYHSKRFFTRTCPEKNGMEKCRRDWYPEHIEVQRKDMDALVTFNLAPKSLGIHQYFLSCFGGGLRSDQKITPDTVENQTHYSYHLLYLRSGINFTCEIAADVEDAVRKRFYIYISQVTQEPPATHADGPSLALLVPVGIALVTLVVILTLWCKKRLRSRMRKQNVAADMTEHEEQHIVLTSKPHPPRLLICYSSNDGPAHVRVVLQLAAFVQKHMAVQVALDLWEALSLMQEGVLGWYSRKIKESDFVLVICSRGLHQRKQDREEGEEPNEGWELNSSSSVITMIGEELWRTKTMGEDLIKYMTAIFEYSHENDVPAVLGLASRYTLTRDLPLLFSHLHGVALQRPGVCLQVEDISENGYTKQQAGAALRLAIEEAKIWHDQNQFRDRTKDKPTTT